MNQIKDFRYKATLYRTIKKQIKTFSYNLQFNALPQPSLPSLALSRLTLQFELYLTKGI